MENITVSQLLELYDGKDFYLNLDLIDDNAEITQNVGISGHNISEMRRTRRVWGKATVDCFYWDDDDSELMINCYTYENDYNEAVSV